MWLPIGKTVLGLRGKKIRMLAYILLSIVLPASVIFVFSTVTSIPI